MDSLTQFVLGAGVGVAVLGRRIGPRQAAVAGGLLGTLPDLDVLVPFDDPVDAFILHRGPTHSLFVQALAVPLFGEALCRIFKDLRDGRLLTYAAVYLIFASHTLLDALTVYGTRIFWPIWPEPVSIGSVFVIDPLYTLPLLVIVLWSFFRSASSERFQSALALAFFLSTVYLAWGLTAQQMVQIRAADYLRKAGVTPERLIATPTPFNSVIWRVIAIDGGRYFNLYLPAVGRIRDTTIYQHPSGKGLAGCLADNEALEKLAGFSKGFYRIEKDKDEILVADLRMGMTPGYVFRYLVAKETGEGVKPVPPERRRSERSAPGDLDWLIAAVKGQIGQRPSEARSAIALAELSRGKAKSNGATAAC